MLRLTTMKLAGLLLGLTAGTSPASEWKTIRSSDGIVVEVRDVKGSRIHEFRATCEISAPMEAVVPVLRDVRQTRRWLADCMFSEELASISATQVLGRVGVKAPWPCKPRDAVFVATYHRPDQDHFTVELSGRPGAREKQKGFVRVPKLYSRWNVEQKKPGQLSASCSFHFDPGGWIPIWIINIVMDKGPYYSIRNLKRMVEPRRR